MNVSFQDGLLYTLNKEVILLDLSARDQTYSLYGRDAQYFSINPKSGDITFVPNFNWDTDQTEFTFRVTTSNNGERWSSQLYKVTLKKDFIAPEPPPDIVITTPLIFTVKENNNWSLFEVLRGSSSKGKVKFRISDDYDGPLDVVANILWFKTFHNGKHVKGFDYERDGNKHAVQVEAYVGDDVLDVDIGIRIIDVPEATDVL